MVENTIRFFRNNVTVSKFKRIRFDKFRPIDSTSTIDEITEIINTIICFFSDYY